MRFVFRASFFFFLPFGFQLLKYDFLLAFDGWNGAEFFLFVAYVIIWIYGFR